MTTKPVAKKSASPERLTFRVDLNVINHLGIGLYSSTPAALTELVANAWDADAPSVNISVDERRRSITIEDTGHGMTRDEIQMKFLKVGYARRLQETKSALSASGKRRVMGRKGIGKLSMFALADQIVVTSQARGQDAIGFKIDVPRFKESLQSGSAVPLEEVRAKALPSGQGTRIELRQVLSGLQTTESFLRIRLARRFSVIDDVKGFVVKLNAMTITKQDRGFYEQVQMLWTFDAPTKTSIQKLAPKLATLPRGRARGPALKCVADLPSGVKIDRKTFKVTGYIASVEKPNQLGTKADSANVLSIFANGRVFAENILGEVSSAKHYQSYLVGEIHADFLDDDLVDRATASREAIKKDDPKYQALVEFVRETLASVGAQWDTWRTELGLDKADPQNKTVLEWIETLEDPRNQKAASKLMTSIKNATIHSDEAKDAAAKKLLYRGAIVGFEKLRLTKRLDRLEELTDVLGPEFAAIFAGLEQIEEAAYTDITRQRLAIIQKFAEISSVPKTLEKVAQQYLFDHLWLLDPGWDRVTGRAEMEKVIRDHLKKVPDAKASRLDISYRASSGRHIVVELKRPSKTNMKFNDLIEQVDRYRKAVTAYYERKQPGKPVPALDIYLILGARPVDFDETNRRQLKEADAKIVTYEELIANAKNAYQEYISATARLGPLENLLGQL